MKSNLSCFCCGSTQLSEVLDLGFQPLANSYLNSLLEEEPVYPLKLNFCSNCTHLQLSHTVHPDELFKNYVYLSGTSNTLKKYFSDFVGIVQNYTKGKRVLDIACNDGSQLDCFQDAGYETFGVDPAENIYPISSKRHKVLCSYFDDKSIDTLLNFSADPKFDVIIAQNVLAHNDYPKKFLELCRDGLAQGGRIFIQTSQADMIRNQEFDTIYHEHLSFFTVKSFCTLAKSVGLKVIDVLRTPIHGTSFVFVLSGDSEDYDHSERFIAKESLYQPVNDSILKDYRLHAMWIANEVKNFFEVFRENGVRSIGFGAAAKGNTFINFSGMKLDYIIDENPLKQGLYTPGSKIPIVSPSKLLEENNPVVIVPLAWNFYDEIKEKVLNLKKNVLFVRYFPKFEVDTNYL